MLPWLLICSRATRFVGVASPPPQSKELARQREALKKSYADVLKRAQSAEQRANQRREDALKCADQYDRTKAVHAAQDGTTHTEREHTYERAVVVVMHQPHPCRALLFSLACYQRSMVTLPRK